MTDERRLDSQLSRNPADADVDAGVKDHVDFDLATAVDAGVEAEATAHADSGFADAVNGDARVDGDPPETWMGALLASVKPSDGHVSDDEIIEILSVGSDSDTTAALCAAKGVTVPMYCVWKTKYRDLNLAEVRAARRRELWRTRAMAGVLVAVVVVGAGGILFGLVRAAQSNSTVAAAPPIAPASPAPALAGAAATAPPSTINRESVKPASVVTTPPATLRVAASASAARGNSVSAPPTGARRYNVQVAATDTSPQGRDLVERLAAAGHPAYMATAVVNNVEVFRVRVGPFETVDEARAVSVQLQRTGYPGAWIVR